MPLKQTIYYFFAAAVLLLFEYGAAYAGGGGPLCPPPSLPEPGTMAVLGVVAVGGIITRKILKRK